MAVTVGGLRRRSALGAVSLGAVIVVGFLLYRYGSGWVLDALATAALAVLYVLVPLVLVGLALLGFMKLADRTA